LFLHQRWACEHAGFRRHDASDVTHVVDTLLSDSSITLDRWIAHYLLCYGEGRYPRRVIRPKATTEEFK
jgi:hypothetical protein